MTELISASLEKNLKSLARESADALESLRKSNSEITGYGMLIEVAVHTATLKVCDRILRSFG